MGCSLRPAAFCVLSHSPLKFAKTFKRGFLWRKPVFTVYLAHYLRGLECSSRGRSSPFPDMLESIARLVASCSILRFLTQRLNPPSPVAAQRDCYRSARESSKDSAAGPRAST